MLEQHVRTLPKSRALKWAKIDLYLGFSIQRALRPQRRWERGVVGGVVVAVTFITFFGPMIAGAMLAGGRLGPFPAPFTVPFAAVFMVLGMATAALQLFPVAGDPWQRRRSSANTALALIGPICGLATFILAWIRVATEPVDPAVARVCLIVIACTDLALWGIAVFRMRFPKTERSALFDEVQRSQPTIWSATVADLENALQILLERERITPEQAERARTLGPGRLAEMDESAPITPSPNR